MTYDAGAGTDNLKLYKDGNLIGATTATGNLVTGDGPLVVGYYGIWVVDESRLWNRALSQTEIRNRMRGALSRQRTRLNRLL